MHEFLREPRIGHFSMAAAAPAHLNPDTMERAMKEKDPVCGMLVEPTEAAGQRTLDGKTFYFCSPACVAKFDKAPQRYAPAAPPPPGGTG